MDNLLSRHRNLTVLVVVLFAQVVGLAVQVKHPSESGSVRLIRYWTVGAITPVEKAVVHTREWVGGVWRNYFYLRNVRKENEALRAQIERMRLEQVRLTEDAGQARRLQALLGFKEKFIEQALPAQVISTTGSEFSRGVYIDKGHNNAGVQTDMPVITPEGIVGKVIKAYSTSSLVLVINDPSSGVGVILEKSRLQGILKGTPSGETLVHNIMADEQVQVGERVLTSGGDRIYPKGLPVGVVSSVSPGPDPAFLNVRVKPAAQLNRLEEVLVLIKIVEKTPDSTEPGVRQRAADILAERLPSVPPKPPESTPGTQAAPNTPSASGAGAKPEVKPGAPANGAGTKPGEIKPSAPANGSATKPGAGAAARPAVPGTTAGNSPKPPSGPANKPVAAPSAAARDTAAQSKSPVTPAATAPKKPGNPQAGTTVPQSPATGTATPKPAGRNAATNPAKPANAAPTTNGTSATKPATTKPDAAKPPIPPAGEPRR